MCTYIYFLALSAEMALGPDSPESMSVPTAISGKRNQGPLEKLLIPGWAGKVHRTGTSAVPESRDVLKK